MNKNGTETKKASIALAGDSTVVDYKEPHIAGWGQIIGKYFKNAVIENNAVGGRSTKTFIKEGRWETLLNGKPDFILLQFGHNDSHEKNRPEATDADTDYMEYLGRYADEAKSIGAEIIFITPMHRRFFKDGKPTKELLPYAEAMKKVAGEKNIFCIDLHSSSGAFMEGLGEEKSGPFFCKPEDRSHFSPEGACKMAELIIKELKTSNSKIKKYLK